MVITPKQVEEKALKVSQVKLKALEKRIDEALLEDFSRGDRDGVCISLDVGKNTPLYMVLENKYNQAGWTLKYEYDQRDGDFVRFTVKRGAK